jgi:catechol 2,3-dioxygenase-like lactoylglutathione lyase family enzyme
MSEELKSVGAITLFVEDLARARSFYLDVFGRPVAFEDDSSAGFKLDNVIINLVTIPAAGEAIAPAVVAQREPGSRCLLSIWVEDVDAACAELARKGVALLNGPVDRPWGLRTACFADPCGHLWELAQELAEGGDS